MSGGAEYYRIQSLATALGYASIGFHVFPCKRDKKPATRTGFKEATTDEKTIRNWWAETNYAIGVATGETSGFWVLDVDIKNDVNGWESLLEKFGDDFMASMMDGSVTVQNTASGGKHFCFEYIDGESPTQGGANYLDGIDIRSNGGYIIAAPSSVIVEATGEWGAYEWMGDDIEFGPAPDVCAGLKPRTFAGML